MIPYQINKSVCKWLAINKFIRSVHNVQFKTLCPLEHRKLLKVSGNDAPIFLQGLVTNDMRHFEEGTKSLYTMFLNNKGRVLYDTIIYKWDDSFMIECDGTVLSQLQKHLKMYKLKRLVDIEDVNHNYRIWVLISPTKETNDLDTSADIHDVANLYKDPRLNNLGHRIIASTSLNGSNIVKRLGSNINVVENDKEYKYLRYKLGVSEGAEDLPPGTMFPLEINCDYLHGVSFHKGCYIGQELTARVHHTGVIRKRIMPLQFNEHILNKIDKNSVISLSNNPKSNIGKLKGFILDYGLGLLRIKEALDSKELMVGKYPAHALKPSWWPIEAPKEKKSI